METRNVSLHETCFLRTNYIIQWHAIGKEVASLYAYAKPDPAAAPHILALGEDILFLPPPPPFCGDPVGSSGDQDKMLVTHTKHGQHCRTSFKDFSSVSFTILNTLALFISAFLTALPLLYPKLRTFYCTRKYLCPAGVTNV